MYHNKKLVIETPKLLRTSQVWLKGLNKLKQLIANTISVNCHWASLYEN